MAAPTLAGSVEDVATAVENKSLTRTATAGNMLIVVAGVVTGSDPIKINDATNGDNKDSQNNTWVALTAQIQSDSGNRAQIFYALNVAGGSTTVRVVHATGGGATFDAQLALLEVDIDGGGALDANDATTTSAANTHYCAPSTAIDTDANGAFVVAAAVTLGTRTLAAADAVNWTRLCAALSHNGNAILMYRTAASALTDERGSFTSDSGGTNSAGLIASFKHVSGGGGGGARRISTCLVS